MKKIVMIRTRINGKTLTRVDSETFRRHLSEEQRDNLDLEIELNRWAASQKERYSFGDGKKIIGSATVAPACKYCMEEDGK
jgi:hypothetical protein